MSAAKAITLAIPFEAMDKIGLAKIIEATGKEDLCFEMLLGAYKEPVFQPIANSREDIPCAIEGHDPFREMITYIYQGPAETATCFFLSEEDAQQCHWLEDLELAGGKRRYDDGRTSEYRVEKRLSTQATKEYKGTTHASNWKDGGFTIR